MPACIVMESALNWIAHEQNDGEMKIRKKKNTIRKEEVGKGGWRASELKQRRKEKRNRISLIVWYRMIHFATFVSSLIASRFFWDISSRCSNSSTRRIANFLLKYVEVSKSELGMVHRYVYTMELYRGERKRARANTTLHRNMGWIHVELSMTLAYTRIQLHNNYHFWQLLAPILFLIFATLLIKIYNFFLLINLLCVL